MTAPTGNQSSVFSSQPSALNPTHTSPTENADPEPHLMQKNMYAESLKNLLHGPHVTEESKKRREILRKLGPKVEKCIQRYLQDEEVRIAIIPQGSTLKGYACEDSDIECDIIILLGQPDEMQFIRFPVVDLENIMTRENFDNRDDRPKNSWVQTTIMTMLNISRITGWDPNSSSDTPYNLPRVVDISRLFLPVAYGDARLIEQVRRNVLRYVVLNDSPKFNWAAVQQEHKRLLNIDSSPSYVSREHIRRWLQGQGVLNVDSEQAIKEFNKRRYVQIGLPDFDSMATIYNVRSSPSEQIRDGSQTVRRSVPDLFGEVSPDKPADRTSPVSFLLDSELEIVKELARSLHFYGGEINKTLAGSHGTHFHLGLREFFGHQSLILSCIPSLDKREAIDEREFHLHCKTVVDELATLEAVLLWLIERDPDQYLNEQEALKALIAGKMETDFSELSSTLGHWIYNMIMTTAKNNAFDPDQKQDLELIRQRVTEFSQQVNAFYEQVSARVSRDKQERPRNDSPRDTLQDDNEPKIPPADRTSPAGKDTGVETVTLSLNGREVVVPKEVKLDPYQEKDIRLTIGKHARFEKRFGGFGVESIAYDLTVGSDKRGIVYILVDPTMLTTTGATWDEIILPSYKNLLSQHIRLEVVSKFKATDTLPIKVVIACHTDLDEELQNRLIEAGVFDPQKDKVLKEGDVGGHRIVRKPEISCRSDITPTVKQYIDSLGPDKIQVILYGERWNVCVCEVLKGIVESDKEVEVLVVWPLVEGFVGFGMPLDAREASVRDIRQSNFLTNYPVESYIFDQNTPIISSEESRNGQITIRIFETSEGMIDYMVKNNVPEPTEKVPPDKPADRTSPIRVVIASHASLDKNLQDRLVEERIFDSERDKVLEGSDIASFAEITAQIREYIANLPSDNIQVILYGVYWHMCIACILEGIIESNIIQSNKKIEVLIPWSLIKGSVGISDHLHRVVDAREASAEDISRSLDFLKNRLSLIDIYIFDQDKPVLESEKLLRGHVTIRIFKTSEEMIAYMGKNNTPEPIEKVSPDKPADRTSPADEEPVGSEKPESPPLTLVDKIRIVCEKHQESYRTISKEYGLDPMIYAITHSDNAKYVVEWLYEHGYLDSDKQFCDPFMGNGLLVHLAHVITGADSTGYEIDPRIHQEGVRISDELSELGTVNPQHIHLIPGDSSYVSLLKSYDVFYILPPWSDGVPDPMRVFSIITEMKPGAIMVLTDGIDPESIYYKPLHLERYIEKIDDIWGGTVYRRTSPAEPMLPQPAVPQLDPIKENEDKQLDAAWGA